MEEKPNKFKAFLNKIKAFFKSFYTKFGLKKIIIGSCILVVVLGLAIGLPIGLTQCSNGGDDQTTTSSTNGGGSSTSGKVTVTFKNADGTTLSTSETTVGGSVSYEGTPTMDSKTEGDFTYKYKFLSWDKSLENITEDTVVTAQYDTIKYTANKATIYYGQYPQSKVTDATIISNLNTLAGDLPTASNLGNWTDYHYYIAGVETSFMYYIDIDLDNDGQNDYRGVYFTSYRPDTTTKNEATASTQMNSGYTKGITHWFKYEEIAWKLLNEKEGYCFATTEKLIDAQAFNNTTAARPSATDYKGETSQSGSVIYGNNYKFSSIRSFLNTSFVKTSFKNSAFIPNSLCVSNGANTTDHGGNMYACEDTFDRIFLLAYMEANMRMYSESERVAEPTDYAKCQGIVLSDSTGATNNTSYFTRSPVYTSQDYYAKYIYHDGRFLNASCNEIFGVRPATDFECGDE